MSAYLSLSPVAAAIYGALNVAGLLALAPGGVYEDVKQGATFPYVFFEVGEEAQLGGFGTRPGLSQLPEIGLRVHVFSTAAGMKEAQAVMAKVHELLVTPPAVTGYSSWAIFHDQTFAFPDELVGGVKVKELVSLYRLYVEEA